MNPTRQLHNLGQSLWLDNITRGLLNSGGLSRYISEFSVTGLTSNPTIFNQAIGGTSLYDAAIQRKAAEGKSGEDLFFELALEDLTRVADLFRPIYDSTDGLDGWVSLEVSPLLASDPVGTIKAAAQLHARAQRPNLFIKIPGTPEGLPAIEASIFAGVPVNVTLLFSCDQYSAAAEAYMRGIERRIEAGLDPRIGSVASLFISRWDKAAGGTAPSETSKALNTLRARRIYGIDRDAGIDPQIAAAMAMSDSRSDEADDGAVPADLRNRLGIAIGQRTYRAYRDLLESPRWRALAAAGAHPQQLLWASTGVKDPLAPDTLYVEALAAPDTINTLPEMTLRAFAEHGELNRAMARNGGDCEVVLARFAHAGIDIDALALKLQRDGAQAFVKSWKEMLARIAEKSALLASAEAAQQ